jgi:hypothetical protein
MSSILGGNSSWLSTVVYLIFLLIAILGIAFVVYWTARLGTRKALREERMQKLGGKDVDN